MRAWMVSLGLSSLVVVAAMVVRSLPSPAPAEATDVDAATDPCFRYGRFECCVRPDDG